MIMIPKMGIVTFILLMRMINLFAQIDVTLLGLSLLFTTYLSLFILFNFYLWFTWWFVFVVGRGFCWAL